MSWLKLFWGLSGRINRLQFFFGLNAVGILATAVTIALLPRFAPAAPDGGYFLSTEARALLIAIQLVQAPFQVSLVVRRLHDINVTGYWVMTPFAMYVASVALFGPSPVDMSVTWVVLALPFSVMLLILMLALGQEQANRFGPPPRPGFLP